VNRHKATLILILASIIYVFSYPFHKTTLIGGIVYSGSCASMIGGFADWWGINKLLKRTIPRNKQKIFAGLSNMVSEELLTKDTLKKLLNKYDTSKLVIEFLKNNNEFENIVNVLKLIIEDNLHETNNMLKKNIFDLIISNLRKFDLHKLGFDLIEISLKTEYEDKVYNFLLNELILISQSNNFKNILIKFIDESRLSYEGNSLRKKIIDGFKGSNKTIAIDIQEKIKKFLNNMKNNENKNRLMLKQWIHKKVNEIKNNNDFKYKIQQWKLEFLETVEVEEYINRVIETMIVKSIKNDTLYNNIFNNIKNWVKDLNEDFDTQTRVDVFLKHIINKFIDDEHGNIGKIVKENLNKYNDTMLIELIESNVGNDLQLIRINGSLVGGIVGIIIFIIKYSLGV